MREVRLHWKAYIFGRILLFCRLREVLLTTFIESLKRLIETFTWKIFISESTKIPEVISVQTIGNHW